MKLKTKGDKNETVKCKLCREKIRMLGTKLCYSCWELEHRIFANFEIAKKIISNIEEDRREKRISLYYKNLDNGE